MAEADEKLRLRQKAERNKERLAVKMDRETRAKTKTDADAALRTEIQAKKKEEHKKQMAELAEKHAAELEEKQKQKAVQDEQRRKEHEKAPLKARWQAILAEKKKKANMTHEQRLEHIEAAENSLREEKLEEMAIKAKMKAKMERDDAFRMAQAKRRQMATEGKRKMAEAGLRKLEWSKKQVAKDKKDREIETRIQQAKMEPVQQDDEDADVIYVNVHRDAEEIRLKVQRSARFKVLFDVICHRFHLVRPTVSFLLNGTPLNEQDTRQSWFQGGRSHHRA